MEEGTGLRLCVLCAVAADRVSFNETIEGSRHISAVEPGLTCGKAFEKEGETMLGGAYCRRSLLGNFGKTTVAEPLLMR